MKQMVMMNDGKSSAVSGRLTCISRVRERKVLQWVCPSSRRLTIIFRLRRARLHVTAIKPSELFHHYEDF